MIGKIASLSLSLLLAGALAVLAQSPTTSAPPGSGATHEPFGATLDHPNPNSAAPQGSVTTTTAPSDQSLTGSVSTTDSATPAATTTASTTTTTTTTAATDNTNAPAADSTPASLPKTGSELPLFAAIGLLALGGAIVLRSTGARAPANRA
jgi:LPXTG-motif cell wall-anchored protein